MAEQIHSEGGAVAPLTPEYLASIAERIERAEYRTKWTQADHDREVLLREVRRLQLYEEFYAATVEVERTEGAHLAAVSARDASGWLDESPEAHARLVDAHMARSGARERRAAARATLDALSAPAPASDPLSGPVLPEERRPIPDCPECNGDGVAPGGDCICMGPVPAAPVLPSRTETDPGREEAWVRAAGRLPTTAAPVLAAYRNASLGKVRIIRAVYAPPGTLMADEHPGAEYFEEEDAYFLPEGWYEATDGGDSYFRLDGEVSHWMPLPSPPDAAQVLPAPREG